MDDQNANSFSSLLSNYKMVYNMPKNKEAIDQSRERTRRFRRIRKRLKPTGVKK